MKTYIEVEITHSGQPSPYADHLHRGTVKIEHEIHREWSPKHHYGIPPEIKPADLDPTKTFVYKKLVRSKMDDETFKRVYSHLVHSWVDEGDWWQPRLSSILKIEDGIWEVTVTEAYTD